MNKLEAVVVYDSKAGTYSPPFFVPHVDVAKRDFAILVNDGKSVQSLCPADFDLYHIGSFDTFEGKFYPLSNIEHLASGVDVKEKK